MNIRVKILKFASLREMGENSIQFEEIPENSTTGDLKRLLEQKSENFRRLKGNITVAINSHYCNNETILRDGDEVAFIPPVSGG